MSKLIVLCVFVVSLNIVGIFSFPKDDWKDHHKGKGRSWEYSTKIEHPAPSHHGYHHKGHDYHSHSHHGHKDHGKAWTHVSDSGDQHKHPHKHYGEHNLLLEKPIHIHSPPEIHFPSVHTQHHPEIPIHVPPIHTIPIHIPEIHIKHETPTYYEPKHYEPHHKHINHYEPKKDSLDINVDHIIDDIQKDLSKTSNYVS